MAPLLNNTYTRLISYAFQEGARKKRRMNKKGQKSPSLVSSVTHHQVSNIHFVAIDFQTGQKIGWSKSKDSKIGHIYLKIRFYILDIEKFFTLLDPQNLSYFVIYLISVPNKKKVGVLRSFVNLSQVAKSKAIIGSFWTYSSFSLDQSQD